MALSCSASRSRRAAGVVSGRRVRDRAGSPRRSPRRPYRTPGLLAPGVAAGVVSINVNGVEPDSLGVTGDGLIVLLLLAPGVAAGVVVVSRSGIRWDASPTTPNAEDEHDAHECLCSEANPQSLPRGTLSGADLASCGAARIGLSFALVRLCRSRNLVRCDREAGKRRLHCRPPIYLRIRLDADFEKIDSTVFYSLEPGAFRVRISSTRWARKPGEPRRDASGAPQTRRGRGLILLTGL